MSEPRHYVLTAEAGHINLSPVGFRLWAKHYLQCKRDFQAPEGFSPVPYFLLCRAIELQLKADHLETKRQQEVKRDFAHDLIKSYQTLDASKQILSEDQVETLKIANVMYKDKGFEYFAVMDAVTAFTRAPNLDALETIAVKLIGNDG